MRRVKTPTPATVVTAAMMGLTDAEWDRYQRFHNSNQFGV